MAEKYRVRIVQNTIRATVPGQGPQGPQGIPGPAGGTAVTYPAGEDLEAGRVVIIDADEAFYFQPSLSAHYGRAFGITTAAATTGNSATIQIAGEIENAAFTFSADIQLFVDTDGVIIDAPPAALIHQKAGIGVGTDKMKIDFSYALQTS